MGGDEVPVPHFGACISLKEFNYLAEKLKKEEFKAPEQKKLILKTPHSFAKQTRGLCLSGPWKFLPRNASSLDLINE